MSLNFSNFEKPSVVIPFFKDCTCSLFYTTLVCKFPGVLFTLFFHDQLSLKDYCIFETLKHRFVLMYFTFKLICINLISCQLILYKYLILQFNFWSSKIHFLQIQFSSLVVFKHNTYFM